MVLRPQHIAGTVAFVEAAVYQTALTAGLSCLGICAHDDIVKKLQDSWCH
jgi:hypothetical protein